MKNIKMIENEKDLTCQMKHKSPILQVIMNYSIPASKRLLCALCLEELEDQISSISFKKAKALILQKQEKLQQTLYQSTQKVQDQLQLFKQKVDNLRSNIITNFDSLLKNTEEWINNIFEFQQQKGTYSIFEEIDHFEESIQFQEQKLKYEFNQFNYSYFKKIESNFRIDVFFKDILSIRQALDSLENESIVQTIVSQKVDIKKIDETDTIYISLNCQQHNNKITQVDLRKNVNKDERLKCNKCKIENTVSVAQFAQQWDQYYNGRQQTIITQQSEQTKRLEDIKGDLYTLIVDLAKIITGAFLILDNNRYLSKTNTQQIDTSLEVQLINMAETLSQADQVTKGEMEEKEKMNEESLNKLYSLSQYLNKAFETFQFERMETINQKINVTKTQTSPMNTYNKISYSMIEQIQQQEICRTIAFNRDGSILAAAFDQDIKIWKFENGNLEKTYTNLKGHTDRVLCLVYSKSRNWIASGGRDETIRLWKDMGNNQWSSSEPGKVHTKSIFCLLMNGTEDQLISGSQDNSIKIWKINYETNQLNYEYSLDKHLSYVYSISLNESETTLVSCSYDKQILIWGKGQNEKWEFKDTINKSVDDFGLRICFINDQTIAWQQNSQGYTHIFKLENGKFIEKPELKIELKQVGRDGDCLFPIVFNKSKQILIQKHNKYVYIIRLQQDGKFKIECDPIDCNGSNNYGALSNDGQYLVIWNSSTYEFKVYRLIYE